MPDQTPEARLAAVLWGMDFDPPDATIIAKRILAALPDDMALFTVDSLAAALDFGGRAWYEDDGRYSDNDYAAAIIKAAKEASE